MIADTPTAYVETLESALSHDESEWRRRAQRGTNPHSIAVVAIASDGRWVGTMAGFLAEGVPMLVGVYVAPDFRGSGVTDTLLTAVEDWARSEGSELRLHVHEDNDRARRAYEKRGFTLTGATSPYNLDPTKSELEMVKRY